MTLNKSIQLYGGSRRERYCSSTAFCIRDIAVGVVLFGSFGCAPRMARPARTRFFVYQSDQFSTQARDFSFVSVSTNGLITRPDEKDRSGSNGIDPLKNWLNITRKLFTGDMFG
jgi:hypothetical protein